MWCHGPGGTIPQPSPHKASLASLSWINEWKVKILIRFSEIVEEIFSGNIRNMGKIPCSGKKKGLD